jgi:glycosyltransferase involved in cell wall biosynthesis
MENPNKMKAQFNLNRMIVSPSFVSRVYCSLNYSLFFLFLLIPFFLVAKSEQPRPKVCLNMIVKNESKVITRCLTSMLPIIDYWVIVDTGSTDGTQQVIQDFMKSKGVPGELHERPWVNFAHNRNEALKLAVDKADYLFFMDADDYLIYDPGFELGSLDKDIYNVVISHSGTKYSRPLLVKSSGDLKWIGVLHEGLHMPSAKTFATLQKVVNFFTGEGDRSKDPQKYQKDAQILEAALKEEPNNTRYVFYLAQSYRNALEHALALKNYEKRAEMGGWDEEVFYSLLQIGSIQETLGLPLETIIKSYLRAYQYRRSRVEPLYQIAHLLRDKKDFQSAYLAAKIAQTVPPSSDILLVAQWMYDYGILLELSIDAYWIGKYEECQQLSLELLKRQNLPENVRTCIEGNLGFANEKLLEEVCNKALKLDVQLAP